MGTFCQIMSVERSCWIEQRFAMSKKPEFHAKDLCNFLAKVEVKFNKIITRSEMHNSYN